MQGIPLLFISLVFFTHPAHAILRLQNIDGGESGVWRSSAPASPEDWQLIQKLKIRAILDLRNQIDHAPIRAMIENPQVLADIETAKKLGIRTIRVPMNAALPWDKPLVAQMVKALTILHDKGNWPILVHCVAGKDRTGIVSSFYRLYFEGDQLGPDGKKWNSQNIWDEMRAKDFSPLLAGYVKFYWTHALAYEYGTENFFSGTARDEK